MEEPIKAVYNEEIHAKRLLFCLSHKQGCEFCPAAEDFDISKEPTELWSVGVFPCKVCIEFVGLKVAGDYLCPCIMIKDEEEAYRRSWEALKNKGYIKE